MNSQLYTAASGLLAEERRLELISNNLANLSTPGYRAQRAFSTVYQKFGADAGEGVRAANAGVALAGTYEVPGPGPMRETGRSLDLALEPDQLLVVRTGAAKRYTRDGALEITSAGALTDAAGHPVAGSDGNPITGLTPGTSVTVDGRLVDGETELGRLLVVRDAKHVLRQEGSNLLTAEGDDASLETVADPSVRPGWLEGSGTNALGELIELIQSQRAFETYQKLVATTMNEVNQKAVNDITG
ncbi:MAG: flagellar hook basal-body protein [Acidobacteriia bacterium]|nr:flagellar hook basal-body protein [Terriglobia bacterium]